LKKKDVIISQKVVPFQKTVKGWGGLEHSYIWQDASMSDKPYLYVTRYNSNENCFVLGHEEDMIDGDGDYFNPEDFELYEEDENSTQEDKQELFEKFLNASFELKAELMNKLFQDQTYLTDKEQEFTLALSKWHQNI